MENENCETRVRILETAAAVFAEHGFAATTIRMICGRARVNLAAVNYHFGSKEGLYREALRYARRCAYDRYPPTFGLSDGATPEQRLHAFIRSFLLRTSCDELNHGFGTLVMRELVDPTDAIDMLLDEGIRQLLRQLVDIVRAVMGEGVADAAVMAAGRGVISQCLFYLFSRSVTGRMSPEERFNADIDQIADQVLAFSLHALNGLAADSRAGAGA